MRRGVLYAGFGHAALDPIFDQLLTPNQTSSHPLKAYGAMGPELFWARDGRGRWIPHDPGAKDENRDCLVRERPWPFCWGDVVWAFGIWIGQPLYLRWQFDDFAQLYLGRPDEFSPRELERAVLKRAVAESVATAVQELPVAFWRRQAPPARLSGHDDVGGIVSG